LFIGLAYSLSWLMQVSISSLNWIVGGRKRKRLASVTVAVNKWRCKSSSGQLATLLSCNQVSDVHAFSILPTYMSQYIDGRVAAYMMCFPKRHVQIFSLYLFIAFLF
jgi:hypothetical protein